MFIQMRDNFQHKNVYNTSKKFFFPYFKEIVSFRKRVQQMFYHAYDSYLKYAYPYDELRPLTCDG
jgi:hypothetical protein